MRRSDVKAFAERILLVTSLTPLLGLTKEQVIEAEVTAFIYQQRPYERMSSEQSQGRRGFFGQRLRQ